MTTKELAQRKIAAAEKASTMVFGGMQTATQALNASIECNGNGVFRDPHAIRRHLDDAQAAIQQARVVLAAVEWPTDAEYDLL